MGGFLVFAGFAGLGVGLVAAVTGSLPRLHLATRRQAVAVMAAGFFLIVAGGAFAEQPADPLAQEQVTGAVQPPAAPPAPAQAAQFDLSVPPDDPQDARLEKPAPEPPRPPSSSARPVQARGRNAAPGALPAAGTAGCDSSYPTLCITPGWPDLDCPDVGTRDFAVRGTDPHRFDADNDGVGCESNGGRGSPDGSFQEHSDPPAAPDPPAAGPPPAPPPPPPVAPAPPNDCDESYPDVCIPPPPPDLNCPDVGHTDFRVVGSDPHNFDADDDELGCES